MRNLVVAAALLFVVSGCAAPSSTSTTTATKSIVEQPMVIDLTASDCFEAVMVLLVDPAVAQAALPANWTAADPSGLLGLPVPSGKGAFWINGYDCATSAASPGGLQGAEFGVLVNRPTLVGADNATASSFDIYLLTQVADDPELLATMEALGLPVQHATVAFPGTSVPGVGGAGDVQVTSGTTLAYSFSGAAITGEPTTATADFWHATPDGIARSHFSLDAVPTMQGPVHACSLSAEWMTKATGVTSCMPGDALNSVFPAQAWTGSFTWMPGASVA